MKRTKNRGPVNQPAMPTAIRERIAVMGPTGKLRFAWRPVEPK